MNYWIAPESPAGKDHLAAVRRLKNAVVELRSAMLDAYPERDWYIGHTDPLTALEADGHLKDRADADLKRVEVYVERLQSHTKQLKEGTFKWPLPPC